MEQDRIYMKEELIGPYEVVRIISAGGMSVVYEAVPLPGQRDDLLSMGIERVALKMVRLDARRLGPHELRMLVQRISREFETLLGLTKLGHPNIVGVLDRGFEDGVPYYAMELVDGVTLGKALEARPRLGQAMTVFAKLCGGVAFLHHGRICHRDLKLSNVMVRADGGEPVLIDFGICLPPTGYPLTRAGELLGTVTYVSPEHAAYWMTAERTRPYLARPTDDLWALGVILYDILTGGLPWRSPPDRHEQLFREIQTVHPPHPSDVYPLAPRLLGDVAMALLEKNPDERPGNASEVLSLLGSAAEESDVLSPVAPRRETGSELTSGSMPTEWDPHFLKNKRGHITAQLALTVVCAVVVFLAGNISGRIEERSAGRHQAALEQTHGARNPETGGPERPAPEGDETHVPQSKAQKGIARGTPLPKRAYIEQKKAPCLPNETTMVGGCWQELAVVDSEGRRGVVECSPEMYEVKVKDGWKCYAIVLANTPSSVKSDKNKSTR